MLIKLRDGRVFGAERARIPSLADAAPRQLRTLAASADGAFLVAAALDLPISVDGLVTRLMEQSPATVRRAAARSAGQATSAAKASAAARNGRLGGGPGRRSGEGGGRWPYVIPRAAPSGGHDHGGYVGRVARVKTPPRPAATNLSATPGGAKSPPAHARNPQRHPQMPPQSHPQTVSTISSPTR